MASIFNSLHIGYSGLNASQVGINTTGQNISNAETEGYTRQRVVTTASTPLSLSPGQRGNGVDIDSIVRVFDSFVYDRYVDASEKKANSDFMKKTMKELSTYFPDIDGVGIKNDLQDYFNLWQSFADHPENSAIKIALSQQTQTLTQHIQKTREQVSSLQGQMNTQLKVAVDEVNRIGKEITGINQAIVEAETGNIDNANDLRDKRNLLEKSLANLINADVFVGQIQSNNKVDPNISTKNGSYSINIEGFNFVDGVTFHPISSSSKENANGFYNLSYERQDGKKVEITDIIKGGKIGAILDLRGSKIDNNTGIPSNGILQENLNKLDAFAKGFIESSNNIYAASSTNTLRSNELNVDPTQSIIDSDLNVKTGTFNMVIYDVDGNIAAQREINIDKFTTLSGTPGSNSISGQLAENKDDNSDNNPNNDVDDFINISYPAFPPGGEFAITFKNSDFKAQGFTMAIKDNTPNGFSSGTNFAGSLGMRRYIDGDSAKNIDLNFELKSDPTKISASASPLEGDHDIALNMMQLQFEKVDFKSNNQKYNETIYGFYDIIATDVGTTTNAVISMNDAITTKYNAVEMEYNSVSKVSIDEEMTNLIKYQTSYGAAAKIITTIDQMMNTLLGIKQ